MNLKEKIKNCRAVLFDMDGVVTDTMPLHCKAWISAFKDKFNITVSEEEIYKREGEKSEKSVKEILMSYSIQTTDTNIRNFLSYKASLFNTNKNVKLFDGMKECLSYLKNKIAVALVTGTQRSEIEKCLSSELKSCFSVIITSSDIKNGKPHPEPYLKALHIMNMNPEDALVVENAPNGIKSAKAAGIKVLALATSLPPNFLHEADYLCYNHQEFYKFIYEKK